METFICFLPQYQALRESFILNVSAGVPGRSTYILNVVESVVSIFILGLTNSSCAIRLSARVLLAGVSSMYRKVPGVADVVAGADDTGGVETGRESAAR